MKAIVNVNKKWGIGKEGKLLCRFTEDSKHFKTITDGGVIICGRKTFEDFPKGEPLENRKNIIVTNHKIEDILKDKIEWFYNANVKESSRSIELKFNGNLSYFSAPSDTSVFAVDNYMTAIRLARLIGFDDKIFVCGGESIYKELVDYCDECYVTMNDSGEEPDKFFPNIDEDDIWEKSEESEWMESKSGVHYKFITYRNRMITDPDFWKSQVD